MEPAEPADARRQQAPLVDPDVRALATGDDPTPIDIVVTLRLALEPVGHRDVVHHVVEGLLADAGVDGERPERVVVMANVGVVVLRASPSFVRRLFDHRSVAVIALEASDP